jgi:hypothetical protein
MIRAYQPEDEVNPRTWHPPPRVRYDPEPNPPFCVGIPERRPTREQVYQAHKLAGTLGTFYGEFGRDR